MARITPFVSKDETRVEYDASLDVYEMSIVIDATRRYLALQRVELEELIEGAKANAGEDDWRNNPDIYGLEEMIDRTEAMLKDFQAAAR